MQEHSHYDLNVVVIPGKQLAVHFGFNENEYEKSEVERLRGHFENSCGKYCGDRLSK